MTLAVVIDVGATSGRVVVGHVGDDRYICGHRPLLMPRPEVKGLRCRFV